MPQPEEYLAIIMNLAPIVVMIVLFYYILIRPQRKRDKAEKDMRSSIIVGDEITTIGGIVGKIVSIKDDTITIETGSDRAKIKFCRWAVRSKETKISE